MSDHVCRIVADISFEGAAVQQPPLSLEGRVVQDADRLDAIGAIGMARAFVYGGARGRDIYDPGVPPTEHRSAESYFKGGDHTINHFYEKLLLLKDRMNTATRRATAEERHRFMEDYLRGSTRSGRDGNEDPNLRASPAEVGAAEPDANPENVYGQKGNAPRPADLFDLLWPLASSFSFWLVCIISFGLTVVRETFNVWNPIYLKEAVGLSDAGAVTARPCSPWSVGCRHWPPAG